MKACPTNDQQTNSRAQLELQAPPAPRLEYFAPHLEIPKPCQDGLTNFPTENEA